MKKTIAALFAALFMALCLLPSAGLLAFGPADAGANEVLAAAPALRGGDGGLNADFLNDLSDYVGERFFLRQEAITAWNGLNAALLHSSASAEVLLGREGWLFYADTLPDYTGSDPMTDRELWCAARTLSLLQEYAGSRGCAFLFTVAPNKNSLYGAYMPAYPRATEPGNAARLYGLLADMDVAALELAPVFAAQPEALYFRTDSHWNDRGAALAADTLLAALGRESHWFGGDFSARGEHRGDLYDMLYPAGRATEPQALIAAPPDFTYTRPIRGANDITIQTESAGEGSLLCFRDSFGNNLYPYLAAAFSSAYFSRQTAYDLSLIDRCQADTVVVELVERNLRYLNTYAPVLPAPARTLSLTGAAESEAAVALTWSASPLADCVTVSGALPGPAADNSPVYLLLEDGTLREATPRPQGFAAHVPAGPDGIPTVERLVWYSPGGLTLSAPLTY